MTERSCFLCGGADYRSVPRIPEYVACHCGLVRRLGVRQTMEYAASYFTCDNPAVGHRDFRSPWSQRYDSARFELELSRFDVRVGESKVLDFGSATGSFLLVAARKGWSGVGVEVSQAARSIASNRGVTSMATLAEAAAHGPFDLITMHHVLEHIEEPQQILREIAGNLSDTGHLLIEVPNWRSLERRSQGSNWVDLRPEQHLWHFNPRTLTQTCRLADLEVVLVQTLGEPIPSPSSIAATVGIPAALLNLARRPKKNGSASGGSAIGDDDYRSDPASGRLERLSKWLDLGITRCGLGKRLLVIAKHSGAKRPVGRGTKA